MRNSGSFITGAAFFVIGAAYLADALGWIALQGRYFWPVLVILAGVAILLTGPAQSDT